MSQASRSCQSAVGQTETTLGTGSPSSHQTCSRTLGASAAPEARRTRWYDMEKRFAFGSGFFARPQEPGLLMSRPDDVAPISGHGALVPAEVVGRGDVGEEVEAEPVAEVERRLDEPCGLDDDGRLAVLLRLRQEPRNALVAHDGDAPDLVRRAERRRGSSPGGERCPRAAPPAAAGSRGRGRRRGRSCRRPGGSRSSPNMPPELAHAPMAITHFGSSIWS